MLYGKLVELFLNEKVVFDDVVKIVIERIKSECNFSFGFEIYRYGF